MLLGECRKCGGQYYGWLLSRPEYRYCPKCGDTLAINEDQSDTRVKKEDIPPINNEYDLEWPK